MILPALCFAALAAIFSWKVGALIEWFLASDLCLPFTRRLVWTLIAFLVAVGVVTVAKW